MKPFSLIPQINMSLITEKERIDIYKLLEKYGVIHTLITPSQQLSVQGLPSDTLEQLQQDLFKIVPRHHGIQVTYIQNCASLHHCKYAVADSNSLGRKIEQLSFSSPLPAKVKVSIAGCGMCCTAPLVRDVGIIGKRKGWTLVFGGNSGGRPRIADQIATGLKEDKVVELVKKCVDFYLQNASTRQRTSRFIEQYGIDNFLTKIL